MDIKKVEKAADPEKFAGYIAGLSQSPTHALEHVHGEGGSMETQREDDYEGHHIEIQTTYKIEVDGEILISHIGVDNEGNLHCHALPNYQFDSAVDMVRALIDNFPEDFKKKRSAKKSAGKASSKKSSGGHNHGSSKHAAKGGK